MDDIFAWFIISFFVCLLGLIGFFIFVGLKIPMNNTGSHSGYVTAVEREGFIYKKYRIYFKTDTSSSQEDQYCLEDQHKDLADKLEKLAESKERVTLKYAEYFVSGAFNGYCNVEITGFK